MEIMKDIQRNNRLDLKTGTRGLSRYQLCLLNPGPTQMSKIPGTYARRSILKHVYSTQTLSVSSNGHACIMYQPYVSDSGDPKSTFFHTASNAYNPNSAPAALGGSSIGIASQFLISPGTVRQARIVGLKMKVYSLSTTLNRTGTLYGALVHTQPITALDLGTITAYSPYTIPTVQNAINKKANVANGEGVVITYMPSDEDDLHFYPANTYPHVRHANGDDVYIMTIIAEGLQVASQIRVEINAVIELIPFEGTTLAGLETPAPTINTIPALEIGHIRNYHTEDIVRICNAFEGGDSLSTTSTPGLLTSVKNIRSKGGAYYDEAKKIIDVASAVREAVAERSHNKIPTNSVMLNKGSILQRPDAVSLIKSIVGGVVGSLPVIPGVKRNLRSRNRKNKQKPGVPKRNV